MPRHQATVPLLSEDAFDVEDLGSSEALDEHYPSSKDGDNGYQTYIRSRFAKVPGNKRLLYVAVVIGMGALFCIFAFPLMRGMVRPDENFTTPTVSATETCSQCVFDGETNHSADDIKAIFTNDKVISQRCCEECKELALAVEDSGREDSGGGDGFNITDWPNDDVDPDEDPSSGMVPADLQGRIFGENSTEESGYDDDNTSDEALKTEDPTVTNVKTTVSPPSDNIETSPGDNIETEDDIIAKTWGILQANKNVMKGYENVMTAEAKFKKLMEEEGLNLSDEKVLEFIQLLQQEDDSNEGSGEA